MRDLTVVFAGKPPEKNGCHVREFLVARYDLHVENLINQPILLK